MTALSSLLLIKTLFRLETSIVTFLNSKTDLKSSVKELAKSPNRSHLKIMRNMSPKEMTQIRSG